MKSTIEFKDHSVGVFFDAGWPYLRTSDLAKAWGYTNSVPIRKHDKAIVRNGHNYIPIEKLAQVVDRATGPRRTLAQEFLSVVEQEFHAHVARPESEETDQSDTSTLQSQLTVMQIEQNLLQLKQEYLEAKSAICKAQAAAKEAEMKILKREAEFRALGLHLNAQGRVEKLENYDD